MSAMHASSFPVQVRAILIVVSSLFACGTLAACSSQPPGVDELIIEDITPGDGPEVEVGDAASVHYSGWVYDPSQEGNRGAYFDGSRVRGVPFHVIPNPGSGGVIEGWHQGLLGMRPGGKRVLTIPPELAYGDREAAGGRIPANSSLVFEIELVRLRKAATREVFQ